MRESMASRGCVIFVGNLPGDVREREVEDLFLKVNVVLRSVPFVPERHFLQKAMPAAVD